MRKALFLSMLAIYATPAVATDPGHCDATPFTLGKRPTPTLKAEESQPKAKPVTAQAVPKKPEPRSKPTLLATCKDGKTRKKGG